MKRNILKSISMVVLAVLFLHVLAVPVHADDLTVPGSGETIITYGMGESFVVTIPATLRISSATNTGDMLITASNVIIGDGRVLQVRISSINYNSRWELENTRAPEIKLTYRIGTYEYGSNILNNSVVLSVADGVAYNRTVGQRLYFYLSEVVRHAGTYRDYLTFTVDIV